MMRMSGLGKRRRICTVIRDGPIVAVAGMRSHGRIPRGAVMQGINFVRGIGVSGAVGPLGDLDGMNGVNGVGAVMGMGLARRSRHGKAHQSDQYRPNGHVQAQLASTIAHEYLMSLTTFVNLPPTGRSRRNRGLTGSLSDRLAAARKARARWDRREMVCLVLRLDAESLACHHVTVSLLQI